MYEQDSVAERLACELCLTIHARFRDGQARARVDGHQNIALAPRGRWQRPDEVNMPFAEPHGRAPMPVDPN